MKGSGGRRVSLIWHHGGGNVVLISLERIMKHVSFSILFLQGIFLLQGLS